MISDHHYFPFNDFLGSRNVIFKLLCWRRWWLSTLGVTANCVLTCISEDSNIGVWETQSASEGEVQHMNKSTWNYSQFDLNLTYLRWPKDTPSSTNAPPHSLHHYVLLTLFPLNPNLQFHQTSTTKTTTVPVLMDFCRVPPWTTQVCSLGVVYPLSS